MNETLLPVTPEEAPETIQSDGECLVVEEEEEENYCTAVDVEHGKGECVSAHATRNQTHVTLQSAHSFVR